MVGLWNTQMNFNNYIWSLYRNSEEGRIAAPKDIATYIQSGERADKNIFSAECHYFEVNDGGIIEEGKQGTERINLREAIHHYVSEFEVANIEEAEQLFIKLIDDGIEWPFQNEGKNFILCFGGGKFHVSFYEDIFSSIEGLSAGLYDVYPEFFLPYLFSKCFDQLEKICQAFSIQLPEIPGKLKKRERAMYYLQVNRILYDFRHQYNLSAQDIVVFLYDFAPKSIDSNSRTETPLPSPSRVWFVIGGVGKNGDFQYLDSANDKSISFWQGNIETRKGDIILMWCASPRSYLHSIWRAIDDGFNDPFFYFYSLIRIGKPIKIPPISFAEFSKHPFLGDRPAVRSHFQGRSGTAFSIEDYTSIIEILQDKNFDVSILPSPPRSQLIDDINLHNEHDVEQMLLEPLLQNLGFIEKDWIRQFPLKMGRGKCYYPDYILGGNPIPGDERAFVLIECKLDIETKKAMKEAFVQAKSYALRLQSKILALAARRGLWIFQRRKEGFSIDHFLFKTWKELSHPDTLHQISLIIGKRKVENSII